MLDTHSLVAFLGDKCVLICSLFRALSRTLAALPNLLYTALLDLSGLTFTKKRASKNNKGKQSKHFLPHPHLDLFNQPIVYNAFIASSTSTPYLRQCAVSEFDYDFSSPNPYSWDFQNLVLNSQGPAALHQGPDQQPVPLVKHHHQPQHQDFYQHQQQQQQQQQQNQHPHPLRNEYEYDQDQDHDQEDQQDSEADLLAKFNSNFHTQLRQTELYQIQAQQQQYQENLHQHQYQQPPITAYIDSDVDSDDDAGYDDPPPLDDELLLSFFRSNRDTDAYINSSDDHVSPLEDPTSGSASGSVSITSSNNTPIRVEINNLKRDIEGLDRHHDSESDNVNVNVNINSDGDGDSMLDDKSLSNSNADQTKCSRPRKKQRKCDTDLEDNADSDEDTHTNRSGRSKPFRVSGEKIYPCSICNATFKVKGYLTRHKKKHATSKPFHCPYFDPSTDYDEHALVHDTSNDSGDIGDGRPRCHPTGGFSRRDTFKTHLKAIHFVYPTGTKSGDRSDKKGRCAACFKEFNSNKTWLESHVMTNSCEGMITRYK